MPVDKIYKKTSSLLESGEHISHGSGHWDIDDDLETCSVATRGAVAFIQYYNFP